MALAGNIGGTIAQGTIPFLFGEDQARYVLAAPHDAAERIVFEAKRAGVAAVLLGAAGGDKIAMEGFGEIALERLRKAHESWFPSMMTGKL
jgi:phosphoribosylformylglycinamidine synthase